MLSERLKYVLSNVLSLHRGLNSVPKPSAQHQEYHEKSCLIYVFIQNMENFHYKLQTSWPVKFNVHKNNNDKLQKTLSLKQKYELNTQFVVWIQKDKCRIMLADFLPRSNSVLEVSSRRTNETHR